MDSLIATIQQTQVWVALAGLIILYLIETINPFFEFFNKENKRGRHLLLNFSLGAANAAVTALLFVSLWFWASNWAYENNFGLLNWMTSSFDFPLWARAALAILLFDSFMYFWHRINHEVPFLWRFHRVHHSDSHMDVTTASRFHTGEIILSTILRIPVIILLGLQIWELFLYGVFVAVVVQFHHANINLPEKIERALRVLIVTPHLHKVHHSRWMPETNSNYGTIFSFWDRLWRTFTLHNPLKTLKMGLDEFDSPEDNTVKGLFTMPFREGKSTDKES